MILIGQFAGNSTERNILLEEFVQIILTGLYSVYKKAH